MKNKIAKITLVAGFILVWALVFSCSSGDDLDSIEPGDSSSSIGGGSLSYQGKTYRTMKIGYQTWMAENLNYKVSGSRCYDDEEAHCDKYGSLYNWATANTVCPSGWHLPSNADWNKLFHYVDGTSNTEEPYSSETAGKLLKATSGWKVYKGKSGNGEDKYGFSAIPGGHGNASGSFSNIGGYGGWWSSSEYNDEEAYNRIMYYNYDSADYDYDDKLLMLSVRCVKD